MVGGAQALDPPLAKALEEMGRAARDLDLAGRGWHRAVGRTNEAIRASGLPYYLDPTVFPYAWQGERRRHFGMRSYRVLRVRQFDVEGEDFATLHVDRLDTSRGTSSLLGFSRDLQPFAIVDRRESHGFRDDLQRYAEADPPQCSTDSSTALGLGACGALLARVVARMPELGSAISAMTDRHELQHQIDGPHLRIPAALQETVPYGPQRMQQANRELSAYLAEMTGTDVDPHLCLVHVGRFAMLGERDMLQHIALLILGTMTDQRLYDADGEPDQHRVAGAFAQLSVLAADELRTRAKEAWATLYGEALPDIEERSRP
jgi:hypothetical protein